MKAFLTDKNGDGRKHGMFSMIRRHINATMVVAVFALVFAMTGGAFAVTSQGGSSGKAMVAKSKAKSKTVRGPAGPRGATGPAGAAGAQGAQGAQGPAGTQGPKGETGIAGTNGTAGATGPQGPQGKEGKEGPGGPAGLEGTTGFTKTLPEGETETGTWSAFFEGVEKGKSVSPISFAIPLKTALATGGHAVIVHNCENLTGARLAECESDNQGQGGKVRQLCPGTSEIPKAAEGYLCIYQGNTIEPEGTQEFIPASFVNPSIPGGSGLGLVGTTGGLLIVEYIGPAGEALMEGTWAVTAPKSAL